MHTPYFYVIRHDPSGKQYAGAKWGKDANPDTFMTIDGYKTSSSTVHNLIARDGISSFSIVDVITEDMCGGLTVYQYETLFLKENEIAKDSNWLNLHENDNPSFGSDVFEQIMKDRYGVSNANHIPGIIDAKTARYKQRTGYANPSQNPAVKDKKKLTYESRTGYSHQYRNPATHIKRKTSTIERYGIEHTSQLDETKQNAVKTNNARYGADNPMKAQHIKDKQSESLHNRHGVDNPMHIPEVKEHFKHINEVKRNRPEVQYIQEYLKRHNMKCTALGLPFTWKLSTLDTLSKALTQIGY